LSVSNKKLSTRPRDNRAGQDLYVLLHTDSQRNDRPNRRTSSGSCARSRLADRPGPTSSTLSPRPDSPREAPPDTRSLRTLVCAWRAPDRRAQSVRSGEARGRARCGRVRCTCNRRRPGVFAEEKKERATRVRRRRSGAAGRGEEKEREERKRHHLWKDHKIS
jgi:hypothetical protein